MSGRQAPGQHALADRLAAQLVASARVGADDLVVDLGAGAGGLTVALARRARRVVAVELDPHLVARLHHRTEALGNVIVIRADLRTWGLPTEPFRVVANPPFTGSTALVRRLLGSGSPLVRADLVLAAGLATRLAAGRGDEARDSLTWWPWFSLRPGRRLAASAFVPRPSVDARLLVAERRSVPALDPALRRLHGAVLRGALGGARQGRRPLREVLAGTLTERQVVRLARTLGCARDTPAALLDGRQWALVTATIADHTDRATPRGRPR